MNNRYRVMIREADREATLRNADSRTASNMLLSDLHRSRWSARGATQFLYSSCTRSFHQAAIRPYAVAEVTVLHLLFSAFASAKSRSWILCSFVLALTHLGMLGKRRRIGLPNTITLLRANLPAFENKIGPAIPVIALFTDFLDGKLARASDSVTAFGTYADFFSDTAVWTWLTLRKEPRAMVRGIVFAAWIIPIAAVTATSLGRGHIVEIPRSRWFRPSAVVEVIIGGRAVLQLLRRANG